MKKNTQILAFLLIIQLLFSCKTTQTVVLPTNDAPPKATKKPKIEPPKETIANFLSEYLNLKYKNRSFETFMYVSVKHQRLYLIKSDSTIRRYTISTASNGIGSKANSYKTPPGLHTVKRKIGATVPYGGILASRVYTGKVAKILTDKTKANADYVTSRIMWLQGEEPGINKGRNMDSYKRYIYIHGTAEEGYLGEPASHGCIRMKNTDVIELFDLVQEGTPILVLKY